MNNSIVIKYSTLTDAEEILRLQKSAFFEQGLLYNNFNLPPLLETIDDIQNAFSNNSIFKAELNNVIAGSVRAAVTDRTCYISRLVVDPEQQNRGIGKMLMAHVESIFQNQAERFELFTGQKSEKNITFYRKSGYEIFKIDSNYTVPVVYMEKWKIR